MDYGGGGAYYDDGLGGLGDDGLGGMGGTYQPQQDMFQDDGLMFMPVDEPQQDEAAAEPDNDQDQELNEALDEALFGEPTTSQLNSADQRAASYDDDEEATEDEMLEDEQPAEAAEADVVQEPEPEDPAAAEAQRQNAWYKECFDAMTEAQRNRLEAYIRSNLQKKTMKKVLQELTGGALNDKVVIAISTITKMFVGELVETARQIAARQGHSGALLPSHIRAAYAALSSDGRVPHRDDIKPLRLR